MKSFRIPAAAAILALVLGTGCHRRQPAGTMVPEPPAVPSFMPGDSIPERWLAEMDIDECFTVSEIPDSIFAVMYGRSFKEDCTVPRDSLSYLTCLHKDLGGRTFVGEMVLHRSIADGVLEIFRKLYDAGYPIERMRLVDNYDADDDASMLDDNSSAFNFRRISRTSLISRHGMGKAVDINPLYNPNYKVMRDSTVLIKPAGSGKYLDRGADFPYKIVRGDLCYRLFKEMGFNWGGDWGNSKDYQHFEMQ